MRLGSRLTVRIFQISMYILHNKIIIYQRHFNCQIYCQIKVVLVLLCHISYTLIRYRSAWNEKVIVKYLLHLKWISVMGSYSYIFFFSSHYFMIIFLYHIRGIMIDLFYFAIYFRQKKESRAMCVYFVYICMNKIYMNMILRHVTVALYKIKLKFYFFTFTVISIISTMNKLKLFSMY